MAQSRRPTPLRMTQPSLQWGHQQAGTIDEVEGLARVLDLVEVSEADEGCREAEGRAT